MLPADKPPPPVSVRWAVLLLVSLAMFGNYYVYDSIAPLADILRDQLGFTSTQVGILNAIYSLPNIIMVLIGGVIVDRIGTRTATLVFAAVCVAGAVLTAASDGFAGMASGRLVFGLGAESMIVAITAALGQWFKGRQLGFAFGLNLSVARAGSYAADVSPVWASDYYASGWRGPLLVSAAFAGFALVAAAVYWIVERSAEPRYTLNTPAPSDRIAFPELWRFNRSYWYIVFSKLWRFNRSYWYIVGLCVTFYSVIFPFRSTFAIEYFQNAHGLTLEQAGTLNGYVFLAAIVATPVFGLLVDLLGRRSFFMAFGSLLLMLVFPVLMATTWNLWISTAMLGVAFSLVPAVLWPSVPYLVEEHRLGTAYGLMTMIQNIGLTTFNLAAGALNDMAGAGAANPAGYRPMLWMFATLSFSAVVFTLLLYFRETSAEGHGLETLRARGL